MFIKWEKCLTIKLGGVSLLGGEPTLHPRLIDFIKISRKEFPDTLLIVLTNGVLLLALGEEFWKACQKYHVHIIVTVYPLKLNYLAIEKMANKYHVPLEMSSDIHAKELTMISKISMKHTFDLNGNIPKFYCVSCLYFNKFNVLKNGRFYMCPIQAHSHIFNQAFQQNLSLLPEDSLDIYRAKDWHEFAEFAARWVPFCRYCDLKHWHLAGQWKSSTKEIEEYV